VANFVDQDLKRTGHRAGGEYIKPIASHGKVFQDPRVAGFSAFRLLFGYVNGENPGPQPENAFRFLISVFPLVFTIIAWLIASRLSFENKHHCRHHNQRNRNTTAGNSENGGY